MSEKEMDILCMYCIYDITVREGCFPLLCHAQNRICNALNHKRIGDMEMDLLYQDISTIKYPTGSAMTDMEYVERSLELYKDLDKDGSKPSLSIANIKIKEK